MQTQKIRPNLALALISFTVLFSAMLACARLLQQTQQPTTYWLAGGAGMQGNLPADETALASQWQAASGFVPTHQPGAPVLSPTPDDPHPLPAMRLETETYVVQSQDTLASIARDHGVSLSQLIQENGITNPDLIELGRELIIPVAVPEGVSPSFKVIPDSELVYGPALIGFDPGEFAGRFNGYLARYTEVVDGVNLNGPQVVLRVAQDFSVSPRLLLAVLEYQSGWVTQPEPRRKSLEYPMGWADSNRKGLYRQLAWAANNLNRGFYLWRVNGVANWVLADGNVAPVDSTINAGTAGVQYMFSNLYGLQDWQTAVTEGGLFATFTTLFGYPFDYAFEPLLPPGLAQPNFQLPFEQEANWAFTGGPHGGWGDGSAWAALDFAPPGDTVGCVQTNAWVVAVADGVIVRTGIGAVVQDLDGDGYEGTGWSVLYMHIESRKRIEPGTVVKAGDRIGHPSCEGGVSTGTHTHLARRYNGEWIPADQDIPFNLDGWVSTGDGYEYNGYLVRNDQTVEANASRTDNNGIGR